MPILISSCRLVGIVTPKFLWKNFRYAHSDHAIVAAIVSPRQMNDHAALHGPMSRLYLSACGFRVVTRRRERRLAALPRQR